MLSKSESRGVSFTSLGTLSGYRHPGHHQRVVLPLHHPAAIDIVCRREEVAGILNTPPQVVDNDQAKILSDFQI